MRRSTYRHNLAFMREAAGLGQKELAAAAGCSTATIQSVELGRLKLSDELAMKISRATGVDLAWLLKSKLGAPPVAVSGNPYHRYHFDTAQANAAAPLDGDSIKHMPDFLLGYYTRLRGIFTSAAKAGEGQYRLAFYKLDRAIESLRKEFGTVAAYDSGKEGPSFGTYELPLVEHDVRAAREHFEKDGVTLDPLPTEETMENYRKFRYEHELPPRAPQERLIAASRAQPKQDGPIKPPSRQSSPTPQPATTLVKPAKAKKAAAPNRA